MPLPPNRRVARFGIFELDLDAGELRRNGVKLRLQEQPFQVLVVLLENAGAVVSREELRQKLWPSDTFVDFDHSLNTAVNKVREALGDSASTPRYVETLARRGYRFIAPVEKDGHNASLENSLPEIKSATTANHADPGETNSLYRATSNADFSQQAAPVFHPDLDIPIPHRGLTRSLFALIQVMYLSFYLAALFRFHAVQDIADSFLSTLGATVLAVAVMVTAGVGIPLRCYLLSAVGFDYQRLGEKFQRIFPLVLALDVLWAIAPFLLIRNLGPGAAFAVSAALLYVPFSERTLIQMAYIKSNRQI